MIQLGKNEAISQEKERLPRLFGVNVFFKTCSDGLGRFY
jgi:hypothetical protein